VTNETNEASKDPDCISKTEIPFVMPYAFGKEFDDQGCTPEFVRMANNRENI
jgi:hypothetical protein